MKNCSTRKPLHLLALSLLLVLVSVLVGMTCLAIRQQQLNRALIAAIRNHNAATAISLLAQGADANAKYSSDAGRFWSWLWDNVRGKRRQISQAPSALLLIVQDTRDPLVITKNLPLVEALLNHGADVNARNEEGTTALMTAAITGSPDLAALLLERGADINLNDADFETKIFKSGKIWPVRTEGLTALQHAQDSNKRAVMELLLKKGADVDTRNSDGDTLLMRAVTFGESRQTQILLHYGADVNAQSDRGKTALMYALEDYGDRPRTVQLLLKKGADFRVKSHSGQTALSMARKNNDKESIRILQQAGAKE